MNMTVFIIVLGLIVIVGIMLTFLQYEDEEPECEWLVVYNYSYGTNRQIIKAKGQHLTTELAHYLEDQISDQYPNAYIVNILFLGQVKEPIKQ
jgi:guanylate kinase